MVSPLVDVIIPVHTPARPIERAVASVVDGTAAPVRVTVVVHNTAVDPVTARLGDYASHAAVRILTLHDEVPSPAGPMNLGLDRADAPFVTLLGSDDAFAPGAIDSWLQMQSRHDADVVLARIDVLGGRGIDPYPPVRLGRRPTDLDPVKDRLPYRSAPLGLVSRRAFGDLRFTEGLASGEDLVYSSTLWFTGRRIAYDLRGPAYVGYEDAVDRVTRVSRSVDVDFAFLDEMTGAPWFPALTRSQREALAVKLLRIHIFDAVRARLRPPGAIASECAAIVAVVRRIEAISPGVLRLLSRADRAVLDALEATDPDERRIEQLVDARWRYRSLGALMPRNPLLVAHRQAPFRTLLAGVHARGTTQR